MNESLKKYSNILSQVILKAKKDEIEKSLDAFIQIIKEEGVILSFESIIKEAARLSRVEIEARTVTLRTASAKKGASDEKMDEQISIQMKKWGKDEIFIKKIEDNSLISGVIIDFPGTRIDSSLSGRLKNLANHIKS